MAKSNDRAGTALRDRSVPEMAAEAKRLVLLLYAEWERETAEACWPSRRTSPFEATIGRGGRSDPTYRTSVHPDRASTERARQIEATLRRVARMVEDVAARGRPAPEGVCSTCQLAPVRVRGECDTCAKHRRRHGEPRPEHLIERARRRAENAMVGG